MTGGRRSTLRRRLLVVAGLVLVGTGALLWTYRGALVERWHVHRLGSEDPDVARGAATWLARRGSSRAVRPLFERWTLDADAVRGAPRRELNGPGGVVVDLDHVFFWVALDEALARHGEGAISWLVPRLGSARDAERLAACRALERAAHHGAPAAAAVPRLTEILLDDPVRDAREAALFAIAAIGPAAQEALPALRRIHDDPSSWHLPPGPTPDVDELVRSRIRDVIERIEGDFD